MNIDWSKAPEGYPFWIVDNLGIYPSDWFRETAGQTMYVNDGGIRWSKNAEHKDRIAVFHKPDTWNGGGLPPVGMICEATHEDLNGGKPVKAEILKHHENGLAAAFFWIDAPKGSRNLLWTQNFTPIRTPDQIAAEERERRIAELAGVIKVSGWKSPEILAAYLDSQDYRKQVKP